MTRIQDPLSSLTEVYLKDAEVVFGANPRSSERSEEW